MKGIERIGEEMPGRLEGHNLVTNRRCCWLEGLVLLLVGSACRQVHLGLVVYGTPWPLSSPELKSS